MKNPVGNGNEILLVLFRGRHPMFSSWLPHVVLEFLNLNLALVSILNL